MKAYIFYASNLAILDNNHYYSYWCIFLHYFSFFLLNFSPSSSTCYSLCYAIVIVHFGHTSSCFSLKIPKHHFRHSVAFCVCTISISYLHTMLSRVYDCLSVYLSVCPWVCFVSWCDDMASMSSTLCSSFWFGCNISRKSHLPPLTVRPLLHTPLWCNDRTLRVVIINKNIGEICMCRNVSLRNAHILDSFIHALKSRRYGKRLVGKVLRNFIEKIKCQHWGI